jgi:hypothetical protein
MGVSVENITKEFGETAALAYSPVMTHVQSMIIQGVFERVRRLVPDAVVAIAHVLTVGLGHAGTLAKCVSWMTRATATGVLAVACCIN